VGPLASTAGFTARSLPAVSPAGHAVGATVG
jgi:hypothetical protein